MVTRAQLIYQIECRLQKLPLVLDRDQNELRSLLRECLNHLILACGPTYERNGNADDARYFDGKE